MLNDQFALKVSVFHKRKVFYSLRQTVQKSVTYVKTKNTASSCNFKKNLNDMLRDECVAGLQDGLIKDGLREKKRTLNRMIW